MSKIKRHAYRAVGVDGTVTLDGATVTIERVRWREMRNLFVPWRGQARSQLGIPLELVEYVELDETQRRVYIHAPRKRVTRLGSPKARNDRWPFTITINDKQLPQWRALVTEINQRVRPLQAPTAILKPRAPWASIGKATSAEVGKMAAGGQLYFNELIEEVPPLNRAPDKLPVWPDLQ
jgi:hypothetical protein